MIDEKRILMQAAPEIANTFMPRSLSAETAEAEIQGTYECFIDEECAPEAADPGTGLPKRRYILLILAEWIEQAEEADRQKKKTCTLPK